MAKNIQNQVTSVAHSVVAGDNKTERLMAEYMIPLEVESRWSIGYPT